MSIQWFNPMTDTPEGLLLGDVQELLKAVRNKKKADLDKDGKLSGYETKRAKAIETSMHDGYKSNRGQRTPPSMPTPKGNKNKIDKTSEILQEMGIFVKNTECSDCKNVDCMGGCGGGGGMSKGNMDEKNAYCQKNFQCNYSQCTPKQKAQCDKHCGELKKRELEDDERVCFTCGEITADWDLINEGYECEECSARNRTEYEKRKWGGLKKYSQESSVENLFPKFQNVDGGMPVDAHGFTTNGTYPATNDGPKKSIISETAKIPAYAQNGYTVKSSSLHMHYNDAGGTRKNPPNIDTIEQRLASLTKHAGRNNLGMIGEIEGLLKQVKDLIETPSN